MQLKKNLQLSCFFISMLLLTSCGGGEDNGAGGARPPVTPTKAPPPTTKYLTPAQAGLIGTWRAPCIRKQLVDSQLPQPQIETFTFTGNKIIDNIQFFYVTFNGQPGNCRPEHKLWELEYTTSITIGPTVAPGTSTEYTKINITRTKVRIKSQRALITDKLNSSLRPLGTDKRFKGYGQTNWVLDEWKELTTIPDAHENFNLDTTSPDIFQISSRQINGKTQKILRWGDKLGNLDRDKRPLALENNPAVRQSAN